MCINVDLCMIESYNFQLSDIIEDISNQIYKIHHQGINIYISGNNKSEPRNPFLFVNHTISAMTPSAAYILGINPSAVNLDGSETETYMSGFVDSIIKKQIRQAVGLICSYTTYYDDNTTIQVFNEAQLLNLFKQWVKKCNNPQKLYGTLTASEIAILLSELNELAQLLKKEPCLYLKKHCLPKS